MEEPGIERISGPQFPPDEQRRVRVAWERRSFVDGCWEPLLLAHAIRQLGPVRARMMGTVDTSTCLFLNVLEQTCAMYDDPPTIEGASSQAIADALEQGGWWTLARQHQQYVRGLHESTVYVGYDEPGEVCTFKLVTPDEMWIEAAPTNESRPETIWWARRRTLPGDNESAWFWDRWSIANGVGTFGIWTNDRAREMTSAFVDPALWSGSTYPYLDDGGKPILPFALYHDRGANGLWSPWSRDSGMTTGTLQVGLLWTATVHGALRASWDQHVLMNGQVKGSATQNATLMGHGVRTIPLDPTSVLQVTGEQVGIGTWSASIDLDKAERFVRMYGNQLAVHFGIPQSDVVVESLNPSSGAALIVSQAGKRAIAKRDVVNFRRGDDQLYRVVAAVLRGRAGVSNVSAKNARTRYHGVALTIDERQKLVPTLFLEMEAKLLDRVVAYQELHPGTSLEDAEADLAVQDERRQAEEDAQAARNAALGLPPPGTTPPTDGAPKPTEGSTAVGAADGPGSGGEPAAE